MSKMAIQKLPRTVEQIVADLAELRRVRESADARLMMAIVEIEDGPDMETIRSFGCETIDQFLKSNGICDPARYRNFRAGFTKLGDDKAQAVALGSDAVMAAANLKGGGDATARYVAAIREHSASRAGIKPSFETAQRIVRQVDPREETPRVVQFASTLRTEAARLQAENSELRARVRVLETEVKELRRLVPAKKKAS
jgi:hypothetical protein